MEDIKQRCRRIIIITHHTCYAVVSAGIGKTRNALESARFLHQELPKRLARRVRALQKLPFIVGVNPYIKKVYQLYYDSFEILRSIPEPVDEVSQAEFSDTLSDLVGSHQDVIPQFLECGRYMTKENAAAFLDGMIHARIGIRVIAEHHIALQEDVPGWIGIINTRLSPSHLLKSTSDYVQELCEMHYGTSPDFVFNGHVDTNIAYISVHLEYVFMELLKNASRATVEWSHKIGREMHPPVEVTIGQGKDDIWIRIRDQGGGISANEMLRVFDYSYTTVPKTELDDDNNIFASQSRLSMQASVGGPIAGLGFGLPMSRIYAKYFGGALELKSIAGHGLDVFLRVPNITITNTSEMRI
ncbi:branched-chain alpha-ketoacid dehydrogenase [Chytridium lagenaria]|nr:branched-chain alpha-ketoacid dehydrogenase [Chytridium lagenaria]